MMKARTSKFQKSSGSKATYLKQHDIKDGKCRKCGCSELAIRDYKWTCRGKYTIPHVWPDEIIQLRIDAERREANASNEIQISKILQEYQETINVAAFSFDGSPVVVSKNRKIITTKKGIRFHVLQAEVLKSVKHVMLATAKNGVNGRGVIIEADEHQSGNLFSIERPKTMMQKSLQPLFDTISHKRPVISATIATG